MAAALAAAVLAGCSEKPQRLDPEAKLAPKKEQAEGPLRERTLKQGESSRIGY